MLTQSNFAKNFTLEAMNAIAEHIEDTVNEVNDDYFDLVLLNSSEFRTIDEALEEYDAKDLEELNDSVVAIPLEHGGVIVME